MGRRKLHIGGTEKKEGWEIFNIVEEDYVDHLGDAHDLSRFEDNTFYAVYASHILEHFDYHKELFETLKEWQRVLVPRGKLYVSVPNLDILAMRLLDKEHFNLTDQFNAMRVIFGGHISPYDYHRCGFNQNLLGAVLKETGFIEIQRVSQCNFFNDCSKMDLSLNMSAEKP